VASRTLAAGPYDHLPTEGARVAKFIERFGTLGASFLGQRFRLLPFQRAVLDDIYRRDPVTKKRLRRTYVLGLPRKSGKSQLGAALALYHLIADTADPAPLVISAAGDRAQARLVFAEAARMVRAHPDLAAACTVYRDSIVCHRTGGVYRVVSADAGLAQGLNPSMVVVDEYHVHKTDDLYTALLLGSGARRQPLMLVISTAGFDLDSPLGRLYSYGLTLKGHRLNGTPRDGEAEDHAFGMEWWGPEPGEDVDPDSPEAWARYNPSWAIMNHEEMAATRRVTHVSQFIRYRLNGWTTAESVWLPHGLWETLRIGAENGPDALPMAPDDEVILGFDGAWKGDSTGLVAVRLSDLHVTVLGHWEAPALAPDWRTPVEDVKATIREACRTYRVREVAADPYRWEQALQSLQDEGLPIVEFPSNSVERMVKATQAFYDAALDRHLSHDGDAALARHISNAVLKEDSRGGRITKDRKSSKRRIDLAVAAVIAVHRAHVWREEEGPAEPQMIVL
jgi:phage terminase large subunit-like protein